MQPTLYQRVLGADFAMLPPVLQQFHSGPRGGAAAGRMAVRHPRAWPRRVLARLLRLPPTATDIPVRLHVYPQGGRELWVRHFGDQCLETLQWQDGRYLVEQAGPLQFVFKLSASAEGLTFKFQHNRLPALRYPVFTVLRIRANASASPACPPGAAWHIQVVIAAPLAGWLTTYEGDMRPLQGRQSASYSG